MCGLAGVVGDREVASRLPSAVEALRHRGPDDEGVWAADGVGLAATRLSVIDLEHGHQPMTDAAGTSAVVFNGEIVNASALRAELETAGRVLRTRCDTEVVLHAYLHWGDDFVARLHGMFSLALWDGERRRLVLAVDRFGIKPLYWSRRGNRLAFASEPAALCALVPDLSRGADVAALSTILEIGFCLPPSTPWADVHQLAPGHRLAWQDGALQHARWWELSTPSDATAIVSRREAARALRAELGKTVAAWRTSDVPVGSLLSGGLDSSSVARLLRDQTEPPLHTFTIGFTNPSYDETRHAERVARALGARHHRVMFDDRSFDSLPEVVRHLGTPQCAATAVPIHHLYRACREAGIKVVMTGEGADELFGGYHWFTGDEWARRILQGPRALRRIARLGPMSAGARRVLTSDPRDVVDRYVEWIRVGSPTVVSKLLGRASDPAPDLFRDALGRRLDGRAPVDQFTFLELTGRLPAFINLTVDRMSMAHGVEARPPFLDHQLWTHVTSLPTRLRPGKALLRDAMAGSLPRPTLRRAKRGLATPHAAWWRQASLPEWAEDVLTPQAFARVGLIDGEHFAALRCEHVAGTDRSGLLTGVLTTQLWATDREAGLCGCGPDC